MLRVTNLTLPLNHPEDALPAAISKRLGVAPRDLVRHEVVRRGNDARRKAHILLVYAVDVTLRDEAGVLARFADDPNVQRAPDTRYRHVATAPVGCARPVVNGAGPGVFRQTAMESALSANWSPDAVAGIKQSPDGLNGDIHGSAEYRAHLVTVMAKRAVLDAG